MADFNIKISELDPFVSPRQTEDFFPLVDSSSMTTYRATIKDIGSLMTHSVFSDTASLALTASYITSSKIIGTVVSASYARSASHADTSSFVAYIPGVSNGTSSYSISASHANLADSASYALSASNALTASYARSASNAFTASFIEYIPGVSNTTASYAITASYAFTASYAISSSNALTASYISLDVSGLPIQFVSDLTMAGTYLWTVPSGVTKLSVICVGAGGGGGSNGYNNGSGAGGGGSGGMAVSPVFTVVPGTVYTIVVGASVAQTDGVDSSFSPISTTGKDGPITSIIGYGGKAGVSAQGGAGGNSGSYNTITGFDGQKGDTGAGGGGVGGTSSFNLLSPGSTYGNGGLGGHGDPPRNWNPPYAGNSGFVMLRYLLVGS